MTRSDFRHSYDMPVRWGDMDALQHVNNAAFIRYLECGRVAYIDEVLHLRIGSAASAGWILAEISCTYHAQLRYPATLSIATRCSRLGTRSAELIAGVFPRDQDEPVASSRAALVWFDYGQQRSTPIPAAVIEAIKGYEITVPEIR